MSLGQKKANCIFEVLSNLYWIVSFLCFCGLQQKIEPSWRNYLFELQNQAEHNITNIPATPDYSLATAIMFVIFWTEQDFCIIFDWGIHSTTNFKTYEQAKGSFKEKRHKFIDRCSLFTWFNFQILNLCHRWHRRIHNPHKYLKWILLWK